MRLYLRFLEATVDLADASARPHTAFTRLGRVAMGAAILRVAEADRALRAVVVDGERGLERAVRELAAAREALTDAARYSVEPVSAGSRARRSGAGEHTLTCVNCGGRSQSGARGWRAYLLGDDDVGACCPSCAAHVPDF